MGLLIKNFLRWPILAGFLSTIAHAADTASHGLELDHVWIVVATNAPERAALERVGLRIAPEINRHDGQGTASITAEFRNTFLELIYVDPAVPVTGDGAKGADKFKQRTAWRSNGSCPIGIGLRRTRADVTLPFPTWSITTEWLPKGSAIEMLTPRGEVISPSFFISPRELSVHDEANRKLDKNHSKAAVFEHPIGVERITGIGLVRPKNYQPVPAFTYLEETGILKSTEGNEWAVGVTFDGARKSETRDLRPDLPLLLHY